MIPTTTSGKWRIFSGLLLLLTGLSAFIGGLALIIDPFGGFMGLSTGYLTHSPFQTYLIPGIVLFAAVGAMNLIAAYVVYRRTREYYNLVILQGIVLVVWIVVQVAMIQIVNLLHLACFVTGILLIKAGRSVRHSAEHRLSHHGGK